MVDAWWSRWFLGYGRATRTQWWGIFLLGLLGPVVLLIPFAFAAYSGGGSGINNGISMGLAGLLSFVFAWIPLSFGVRRVHDMSISGWWYVGSVVAMVVLLLISEMIGGLVGLAYTLWLGFAPGTRGKNNWGPDPRDSRKSGHASPSRASAEADSVS